MNKKAFTLIELLGSIAILAMIALVAFPSVLNLINNSQNKIDKSMEDYVISSAREYVNDHVNDFPRPDSNGKTITIDTLIDKGYISDTTINDNKNKEMKNDKINVKSDNKKYSFEYVTVK